MNRPTSNAVHDWFGLSYSNYLVVPRTLLQSMPDEWQTRFVKCVEELQAAFDHIEHAPGYEVKPARSKLVNELSLNELEELKITIERIDDAGRIHETPTYYDERGREHDRNDRVMVPVGEDPIPHYNRGRTYIEPRI
jgi:hypothetical protein